MSVEELSYGHCLQQLGMLLWRSLCALGTNKLIWFMYLPGLACLLVYGGRYSVATLVAPEEAGNHVTGHGVEDVTRLIPQMKFTSMTLKTGQDFNRNRGRMKGDFFQHSVTGAPSRSSPKGDHQMAQSLIHY
eukprot:11422125-Ditylum_brightwellii.AAC.1